MDRTIAIKDFPEMTILGEQSGVENEIRLISEADGVYLFGYSFSAKTGTAPEAVTLRWRMPSINVKGVWTSASLHEKRQQYDWELEHLNSRVSVDAPVVSVFGHDDKNVVTFACEDAINKMEMNALLREEDNHLYCHLSFFTERHHEISDYETQIRVDTRGVLFSEALQEVSDWWATFEVLKPSPVPDLARAPLYSTWYQFHQDLDVEVLLEECKIAASVGYELIILDDGWQTLDGNRGYDYCGDWEPERIPDMRGFVERMQAIGMKVGLWYSVPFCGKHSKAYQRFKGKFLTENHRWAPVFDPRYPDVREYLIETYKRGLKEWKLDAFKLDFIDDFQAYPDTVLTKENGRDYANVNEAVDRLMTDVMKELRAIKPDIAIEFRQKYIGPAMRKFGNMFRAFDCPNDAVSNRIRTTDVKLLCGNTAVHSDPQTWHRDEPVELAAFQVLNGFFGVPQMSVHLRNLPKSHFNMIQFYTKYWKENAGNLLGGKFTPINPLANYPILKTEQNGHVIFGIFDDVIADFDGQNRIDLLNVKVSEKVAIRNLGDTGKYHLTTWNCEGKILSDGQVTLPTGLIDLDIPQSGMASLRKI